MKGLLLTTAALLLGVPAMAADMPAPGKAAQNQKTTYAADTSWTGFYAGGHGGYGWGSMSYEIDLSPFTNPDPKGWVGGAHVGYLWQYGNVAGGLEVDYSVADIKNSQSAELAPGGPSIGLKTKFDTLASVRGRGGIILGEMFVYATGGLGFGKSQTSVNFCATDCVTLASSAENHWGWVLGGGLELKPMSNIVIGAEYLHYDFGTQQHNFGLNPALLPPIVLGLKADSTVDVMRGRMSFRF